MSKGSAVAWVVLAAFLLMVVPAPPAHADRSDRGWSDAGGLLWAVFLIVSGIFIIEGIADSANAARTQAPSRDMQKTAELLKNPDPQVAEAAVDRLAAYGPAAVPATESLLRHNDVKVRLRAVAVLDKIRHSAAYGGLAGALTDTSPEVRAKAAEALGNLGDERAIKPLQDLLAKENDADVREAATEAIGRLRLAAPVASEVPAPAH